MTQFTIPCTSIAEGPEITFHFDGDTCRAELVGATLYVENAGEDRADMRLTDAAGEVLADLVLRPRAQRTMTENVIDVGSALLWSHWRFVEAKKQEAVGEVQP